ncbi:peptidyl-tRNA hydrolase-domain-containing protein [Melampsora americana]|nr:peptidyl-tRNA hydrolase-domain-containing protein [Melampsora americana]
MTRSIVIAALGNYTHPLTRHSIAQLVLHNLHHLLNQFHKTGIDPSLKTLDEPIKSNSLEELSLHLIKPRSLMNLLGPIVNNYHSNLLRSQPDSKLILIHDELDLSPLLIKRKDPAKSFKSHGHNGLRSILASVPSSHHKLIYRIGIGIGRDPMKKSKDSQTVGNWVMSDLKRDEIEACSWIKLDDLDHLHHHHHQNLKPKYGDVVKEVWENVRDIIQMD